MPSPITLDRKSLVRLAVVTVLTGVGAGLGGMLLALLLHAVQHIAYGYSLNAIVGGESFLQGVDGASPERRVIVMAICGLIAGFGWWAVRRFGRPLVSIKQAVKSPDARMPMLSTLAHALLQIVTVALGSPLGREVAPREVGSLVAGWLARVAGLSANETRVMIACGAGAGLAAVYNVPLGGAVFVLEVLLVTFDATTVAIALVTSVIAAVVAWMGLGDESQYAIPSFALSGSLVAWSVAAGPLFGIAAYAFSRFMDRARNAAPGAGWLMIPLNVLNFAVIGLLAMHFPQLLGNGKGTAQLGFDGQLSIGLAAALLALKVAVSASSLRVGAHGGLLTPGLTVGALLAVVLGGAWNLIGASVPTGAFALVGAAAFLASSMNMPITAIVLVAEFTHLGHDMLFPVVFAVAGSIGASRVCAMLASRASAGAKTMPTHVAASVTANAAQERAAGMKLLPVTHK
ncbi:chloride channel protein [Paraburkholderia terrae]|uniref:Chloride channel protein n=1 Tax=Paraburkholderia terrae TaxID=311230 RepID=A0A2I8EXL5_9BURK|nr:chloride channel protein [Paraburkholderia terrae]AUT64240.1 chloride channel protein [Paraburkholderia terrae]